MKLLFDENLASRLATALADLFPESQHVHSVGLGRSTDEAVWNDLPLTDAQRAELDRRLAEHEAKPDEVVPWEDVKASIGGRLKR